ncbi:serine/arginine-rich protein specific kinase SRPK [Trypanosoma grayi]|uniref:serine/arginine-rich protein specific kinase SRPK n=1 Tax=Trypanosoma grayi TaxID=71804 RepID=UPI0004F448E0|nr:serine/arginine-rich protein specific kinase SRPK [Trypanosoma grayi]KEG15468.1 serine/arginine-rich protein specific kinase SRPK [Trypanosoma grayi]
MDAGINAIVEEIEHHDEPSEEKQSPKVQPKRFKQRHPAKNVQGLTLKPGMTAAQAHNIASKMRQQQPLQNIPDQSFDEADEDETDADQGGSGEDYSDTANERATEYRKGGYHPVAVGEVYHDRYRVVKKLGWGYFSTVWLVWDYAEERYQAMKVQKSASHYTEAAHDEIKLLGEIMSADPDKTRCCTRLNDYFEQTGPNGTHVCMIFDVYGEDLLSLIDRYEYRGVPLPIVKCISRQILVGLEHVHALEIIHTDLKPENVLLSTPKHAVISLMKRFHPPPLHQRPRLVERDPKTMTKSQRRRYYKKLKASEKNGNAADNSPEHDDHNVSQKSHEHSEEPDREERHDITAVESETDSDWEIERLHHVVLADFGNSCWTYRQFTDEVQTRQYRCPEVILGEPYSTPIDLWSAACMIFELITGEFLFDPRKGDNYSRDEDHLALMTELMGELPDAMRLGDGKYRSQFYNSRGELRNIKDLNFWSLEDVLYRKHKFTRKKAGEIAQFLLPMLEFDPQKRATATEMLANFEHFFEIKEDDYSPFCFVSSDVDPEGGDESSNDEEVSEVSDDSAVDDDDDDDDDVDDDVDDDNDGSDDEDEEACREGQEVDSVEEDADAMRYWVEHPILNQESLKKRGLTVFDIQAVLSGKRLDNAAAHEAAAEVIRLLSEDADDGSDGHFADREDGAVSSAAEQSTKSGDSDGGVDRGRE